MAGNALGKSEESSSIDPRVDKLILKLSENQKKLTFFSFQVIDTIDEVQKNGQKLQFSHTRTGTVSQPNKDRNNRFTMNQAAVDSHLLMEY